MGKPSLHHYLGDLLSSLLERLPIIGPRFKRNGPQRLGTIGLRPDIQGLRAFAVIAVILDHLIGWPRGGFVGVDVFFVISGFVITGSLLREFERTGRISFASFYKRRIKRIMPAAVLVLIVTVIASYLVFNKTRFMATLWDGISALLFSANWRFAAVGTDYFQADGPVSPLQHYWSLAVEEQFYFIWPAVMAGVLLMVIKKMRSTAAPRAVAGTAIGLITIASFVWALSETTSNPNMAYFSTLSRGWELGVGAGLAIAAPILTTLPAKLRPLLAWVGLVSMATSLFVIDAGSAFPAPGAALPVLATALVITAGTGTGEHRGLGVLTNPLSRYLGDISYSLYLWHFPIIVIGGALFSGAPFFYPVAAATILAISYYSYELLEDPIRKGPWLTAQHKRRHRDRVPMPESYKYKALSLLAILTLVVAGTALTRSNVQQAPAVAAALPVATASTAATASAAAPASGPAVAALQKEITASLTVQEWPQLTPSMDDAIGAKEAAPDLTACGGTGPINDAACTWGSAAAPKTALIVGDSISVTYASVLQDVVKVNTNWKIKSYGTFGCLFTSVQSTSGSIGSKCTDRNNQAVAAINQMHPDVVIISNHYLPRAVDGQTTPMTPTEWAASMSAQVAKFKASTTRVVFLSPPPADINIGDCYTKVSKPADCVTRVTAQWQTMADTDTKLAASVGGTWVDSRQWFCDAGGVCPSFVGVIPTKIDRNHMTQEYGHHIASALAETLTTLKIL